MKHMTCCSLLCEGKLKMVDNSQSYRSWPCSSRLRPRYLGFSGPPSSSPTLSKLIHDTRHVSITYDYSYKTPLFSRSMHCYGNRSLWPVGHTNLWKAWCAGVGGVGGGKADRRVHSALSLFLVDSVSLALRQVEEVLHGLQIHQQRLRGRARVLLLPQDLWEQALTNTNAHSRICYCISLAWKIEIYGPFPMLQVYCWSSINAILGLVWLLCLNPDWQFAFSFHFTNAYQKYPEFFLKKKPLNQMFKTRQSSLLLSWHKDMFIILTWKIDFVKCKSLWSCSFSRINVQLDT